MDDGRWAIGYDAENRPTWFETAPAAVAAGVPKVAYHIFYDYLGRRVIRHPYAWGGSSWVTSGAQERYLYRGWNLIARLDDGVRTKNWFWGLDLSGSADGAGGVGGLLLAQDGGQSYFPAYDALGNIHAMIRASDGALAACYEYDAFGQTIRETGTYAAANPFRFSTKYTDIETTLVYYGTRYYSPSLGRFINRDTISEAGGLNLYAFVNNNPVNRWDLLGMADGEGWQYSGGTWYDENGNPHDSIDWGGAPTGQDIIEAGIRGANNQNWMAYAEGAIANQMANVSANAWGTLATAAASGNAFIAGTTTGNTVVVTLGQDVIDAWQWVAGDFSAASGMNVIAASSTFPAGSSYVPIQQTSIAPNSTGYGQSVTITIPGSGTPVDAFPYANTTSSDCGIAAIRNIETLLTGNPARPRADVIALLGEPAGTFENGGAGMTRPRTNFNAALNPIGFRATTTQVNNQAGFVTLVGQGNIMAVGTTAGGAGHMVVVVPVAPGFTTVRVYNQGPTTTSGNANVVTMSAADAARLPSQVRTGPSAGASSNIWVVTPVPPPTPPRPDGT